MKTHIVSRCGRRTSIILCVTLGIALAGCAFPRAYPPAAMELDDSQVAVVSSIEWTWRDLVGDSRIPRITYTIRAVNDSLEDRRYSREIFYTPLRLLPGKNSILLHWDIAGDNWYAFNVPETVEFEAKAGTAYCILAEIVDVGRRVKVHATIEPVPPSGSPQIE